MWKKLLNLEQVSIHDDFFELGGHSLMAAQLVSMIELEFSFIIPIKVLFQYSNITELAQYLLIMTELVDNTSETEYEILDF